MVKKFISILLVLVMICCCCISASAYQEGVNKVVYHKWGYEVYLSKTAVNLASIGVNVGAVFVPPIRLLQATVIDLGSSMGLCPGGIVLEITVMGGVISKNCPIGTISCRCLSGFRWQ